MERVGPSPSIKPRGEVKIIDSLSEMPDEQVGKNIEKLLHKTSDYAWSNKAHRPEGVRGGGWRK